MIYCLKSECYPTESIEEITYQDKNDFEWKITRVENGFFVKYNGDPYFRDDTFYCELSSEFVKVRNTNCIFIPAIDFETFEKIRNIIKSEYTDDIWEEFQEMFTERFKHDRTLLKSEL